MLSACGRGTFPPMGVFASEALGQGWAGRGLTLISDGITAASPTARTGTVTIAWVSGDSTLRVANEAIPIDIELALTKTKSI